jgi:hypothetical protein
MVKIEFLDVMARVVSVIFSTLVPSIIVLGLYYIHSTLYRFAAIILFSFVISAGIEILTSARPVEIFGATVA